MIDFSFFTSKLSEEGQINFELLQVLGVLLSILLHA